MKSLNIICTIKNILNKYLSNIQRYQDMFSKPPLTDCITKEQLRCCDKRFFTNKHKCWYSLAQL